MSKLNGVALTLTLDGAKCLVAWTDDGRLYQLDRLGTQWIELVRGPWVEKPLPLTEPLSR